MVTGMMGVAVYAESGGLLGAKDEASADAAEMIAKARAAVKKERAGPGVSVLHQVGLTHPTIEHAGVPPSGRPLRLSKPSV